MRSFPLLLSISGALLLAACAGSRPAGGPLPLGFGPRNRYDRHDQPQGRWRTYYDEARKEPYTTGRYRHGQPIRTFKYYAPTGALDHSEKYGREGFCEVTYWYPSGKPARRGQAQWLTGGKGARFYWFGPWASFSEQGDTTALDAYDNGTQARRIHFEQGRRAWVEAYDKYGRVVNTTRL
ncbi:hypothetical protein [uncultured Hymenobacter sp.]|uniref:hypothetical protein n=1 Tax=uncultured Hymenobacter sp. TaxID=170016 RepID=UPI0035CA6DB6